MRVSLVSTLLNEAHGLGEFLTSLEAQLRLPDEWVVVDGGSTDGTCEALTAFAARAPFPVLILSETGCNIARGRNLAIQAAQHDIIAATDAGCTLDKAWLDALVRPFDDGALAVAGWYEPDHRTPFERWIALATFRRLEQVDPATFLPSSRSVAFRREVWKAVGGYPEGLRLAGEDTAFDLAILKAGYSFAFASKAVVRWRPRGTLGSFIRQQFLYGYGDGEAGQAQRFVLRNIIKTTVFAGVIVSFPIHPKVGLCLVIVLQLILVVRLRQLRWPWRDVVPGMAILPPILAFQAVSQVLGYLSGAWHGWKAAGATFISPT